MASPETSPSSAPPPLALGLRLNLSGMMFLQFAVWGAWFVVQANFLGAMNFSEPQIGNIYATMYLGAMLSPIFIGQIADRYFASEKLMALLHILGAGALYWMATLSDPTVYYWAALVYALAYSPTLALSNSVAFTHVPDATRDFPGVRVLGTIGWIIAGLVLTVLLRVFADSADPQTLAGWSVTLGGTRLTLPLLFAAGLSLVLGVWSFFLPHTPPTGKAGDALPFLRAVSLMREPSFGVFYGVSFIITIALSFYYTWTGPFLQNGPPKVEGANVSSIMAIGQGAEIFFLVLLPLFLRWLGMKWVLALGMAAWGVRYGIFALGEPFVLILLGIALHGICFDFFLAAGFIYVDNESPKDIRASAQALFGFLTYGAGMYLGSVLSGYVAKMFTTNGVINWTSFWIVPAIGVTLSLLVFVVFFREAAKKPELGEQAEGSRLRVEPEFRGGS
ncbi:MAG: nucleoside permease [Gemmatales bacterium]|nr:MAG: nucleoside permease [Gemmatales bacterium]